MRGRFIVGLSAGMALFCVCALAVNLAAAAGLFGYADEPVHLALLGGPGPEVATRQYLEAISAKDIARAKALTCAAQQGIYANPGLFLSIDQELSGMRYETIRVDGDRAEVRETGTVKVSLAGLSRTEDVNNVITMAREGGRWKYCPPAAR